MTVNRSLNKRVHHPSGCRALQMMPSGGGISGASGQQGGPIRWSSTAPTSLEPMNAYEAPCDSTPRFRTTPDITTYSVGTGPNRRTVVAYSQGEHPAGR